jgi:hypothetical protein
MCKALSILVILSALAGCASESPQAQCVLGEPACDLEDHDGDGIENVYDDFPEDPLCATEDASNCGACGAACVSNASCIDSACACAEGFQGEDCELCADPLKTGLDCDECVDPAFAGLACEICASDLKMGEDCTQCVDERFTGDYCDVCADPVKAGPECASCKNTSMTGEACDEPVEPNPEDMLVNCLDYRACVVMGCEDAAPDEMESCANQALSECGDPLSEAETDAAQSLVDCMLTKCDSLGESSSNYECWRLKCLPEHVTCATSDFGEEKCEHLGACFSACGGQLGDMDWGCARECLSTGSVTGVTRFIDLDFCLRAECYEAAELKQCKQEVRFNTPICQIPMIECMMDD